MKYFRLLVFSLVLMCMCFFKVDAYTKEDIVSLTSSFKSCSSTTTSIIKGLTASYSRMLNERDITPSNLNKIYNNLNSAINTLKKYEVCSLDDKNKIPSSVYSSLYSLYNETNNIILSSPKISNTDSNSESKNESNIVIDSTTNQIKVYENGALSDVIETEEKLNYVGLNKLVYIIIIGLSLLLVALIILKKLKFKNTLVTSLIYVSILLLSINVIFRNQISLILDVLQSMNVKINEINKEVLTQGDKIISYPLYGNEYGQIYINDSQGDIYFGDSSSILKKGVGQKSSSYLPGEGKTTILSGHNTGVFKELNSLNKDDEIIIETTYGKFIYKVEEKEIVEDTNVEILEKDYDLILYTCYPNSNLYGDKRVVVFANLKSSKWLGDINEE